MREVPARPRSWGSTPPGRSCWSSGVSARAWHVGIITGMRNGQSLITQHTPAQRNVTLHYWLTHGGTDVHVWIVVPNVG